MLKPRKRLTKKEIKQDSFVIWTLKATDFVERYTRHILYCVLGLVVIVAVVVSYSKWRVQKETKAASILAEARAAQTDTTRSGKERQSTLLRKVASDFKGTHSGDEAMILLADLAYDSGRYEEARSQYERYLRSGGNDLLQYSAMTGVAACLEQQQKLDEASLQYQKIADKSPKAFYAPIALLSAGRCYRVAGKVEDARRILDRVVKDYAGSQFASQAKDEIKGL